MLAAGQQLITENPWLSIAPAVLIIITAASRDVARRLGARAALSRRRAIVSADRVTTVTGARTEPEVGHDGRKALRVEHLTITAPGHRMLVADVDLALDRGQTLGIVGESGAGSRSPLARSWVVAGRSTRNRRRDLRWDRPARGPERTLRSVRGSRLSLAAADPFTMLNPLQTVGAHLVESLPRDVRKNRGRAREETSGAWPRSA